MDYWRRRKELKLLAGVLGPTQLSKIAGWLRLADSTAAAGEWPTIVDRLNAGSPLAQTDADRKPAVGAAANGYPTAVFDGTDVMLWPQSPAFASTTKLGLMFWYKPASIVAGFQILYVGVPGIGGVTNRRLDLYQQNGGLQVDAYVSNTVGRHFATDTTTLTANAWHRIYLQYDSSRGGDANVALFVNSVSKTLTPTALGGGGSTSLGALQAAGGSSLVSGQTDSDTPSAPISNGGQLGPNAYVFNANLTTLEEAQLGLFEAPT